MNVLLDTHVLLWWLNDDPALPSDARTVLGSEGNVVFVSAATVWEIRIKQQIGKLEVPDSLYQVLVDGPYLLLDVTAEHADHVGSLPLHHRDPFDRMLVAQARIERLALITHDAVFRQYEVRLIDA